MKKMAVFSVSSDDYGGMVAVMEDRDNLPKTHAEFIANLNRKMGNLTTKGVHLVARDIPLQFVLDAIKSGKVKANPEGRATLAAMWARQMDRLN